MYLFRKKNYEESYKKVCTAGNPYQTYEILNYLEKIGIPVKNSDIRFLLPSVFQKAASSYLAQIVLRSNRKISSPEIMAWVSDPRTKIVAAYPSIWRHALINKGITIDKFESAFLFFLMQGKAWISFFLTLKNYIKSALFSYRLSNEKFTAFVNLAEGAIPIQGRVEQKYTVIDYFAKESPLDIGKIIIQSSHIKRVQERNGIIFSPHILPALSKKDFTFFLIKSFFILTRFFFLWLCGNWKASFLAGAALELAYFEKIDKEPDNYFFSNSDFAIRPFWTYAAQERGKRICLYFYSANVNCFYQNQEEEAPPPPGYILMSWPEYFVADDAQKDFLQKKCFVSSIIRVVGHIDYADSDEPLPEIPHRSIALFDVSPFQIEYVSSMALIAPYYTNEILSRFLIDITDCAREQDINIIWKRKRNVAQNLKCTEYGALIQRLEKQKHITLAAPGISAKRLLERVNAAISIPFTSTAFLASEMHKNSIFYDPTKNIRFLKGLSRNIPTLHGKEELSEWMKNLFNEGMAL